MAEFSIDQNKLPGVKEVVRDFAVLEDHCLAHNLQEQEIESHLASNIHKSRLVQQDVALAKQLQEEEDRRAKAKAYRQHRDIERSDNEIAQEIQVELVRQAKQQRMQEEKDAAIARKLQEKEMKGERKRQKQLEANFEEEYYEDKAIRAPLDLDDKPRQPGSNSHSSERDSAEPSTSSLSRYPEHHLESRGEGSRGKHGDTYPEHHHSNSRGKHGDRYPDYHHPDEGRSRGKEGRRSRDPQGSQSTFFADSHEPRRHREDRGEEGERVVRRKERPARPPPPSHNPVKRDEAWDRERDREWEKDIQREPRKSERDSPRQERHGERSLDREHSRDKPKHKEKDRERTKIRERGLDEDQDESIPSSRSRAWNGGGEEAPGSGDDEGGPRARLTLPSGPIELCEEDVRRSPRMGREKGERRGHRDPGEGPSTGKEHSHTRPAPRNPGRIVQGGPGGRGAVVVAGEYGLGEATQGITKLDLRDQELLDMEVARKLQEEEVKASKMDKRSAQVAQDEEIARLLMEQEKMEYKKSREKEKQKQGMRPEERGMRPEERGMRPEERGMRPEERRRPEGGDYKPSSEEVVRPRLREEEYQKPRNHQKPARPSQPPPHDYENVESIYSCSESHYSSRTPARPEAAYKGVYYRQ
ncbi:zinc finger CCCH domain-containing protein 13 [Coregonus clupeaformis]|uniref:zinc finger CCCH domain-containing protein 13 n=1 Tax=Coregonus clupeaformis TaxID=59861 RepID=UPI001E1C44C4|nr:zinc finger CCCH domain-containing protein 13 [Coregonus clupeaformis]XP_045079417.1 zinc finger CCCH domain-containing protein 13 [Coregonus clupeaformis]XP_045079418.1 zinc finger CCCH domain-containing protein 13 [Coregonus clupeaformis]